MDFGKIKGITSKIKESTNLVVKIATESNNKSNTKKDDELVSLPDGSKCFVQQVPLGEIYSKKDGSSYCKVIKIPEEVDSLAEIQSLLRQLAPATTEPMSILLQNQLLILESVSNASMTLMAVDNMIFSLSKAIQCSNSDNEKILLRDNFSMMIQSFLFFAEAKLMYAIEANRQNALKLYSEAGDMLSKCVSASVLAAANLGGKKVDKASALIVKNLFDPTMEGPSFLNKFLKYLGNKKIIEEKKQEFNKMVANMFLVFDKYSELIGPNILINGMLLRYANDLTLEYEARVLSKLGDRICGGEFAPKKTLLLKQGEMDADFLNAVIADVESDEKAAKRAYEHELDELKEYQTELKKIGLFAHARKEELQRKIANQEEDVKRKRSDWEIQNTRKEKLDQLLAPILSDIDSFSCQYTDIANKFATNGFGY